MRQDVLRTRPTKAFMILSEALLKIEKEGTGGFAFFMDKSICILVKVSSDPLHKPPKHKTWFNVVNFNFNWAILETAPMDNIIGCIENWWDAGRIEKAEYYIGLEDLAGIIDDWENA